VHRMRADGRRAAQSTLMPPNAINKLREQYSLSVVAAPPPPIEWAARHVHRAILGEGGRPALIFDLAGRRGAVWRPPAPLTSAPATHHAGQIGHAAATTCVNDNTHAD
jgi:hypothetical protein